MSLLLRVNAGNDTNGNPRRGWIQYGFNGAVLSFIDEGYQGRDAITSKLGVGWDTEDGWVESANVLYITAKQYRDYKKNFTL